MHFHENHCWCSNSNWNDENYDSRYMVVIDRHLDLPHIERVPYRERVNEKDWDNLTHLINDVWCQESYDEWIRVFEKSSDNKRDIERDERFAKADSTKNRVPALNQEVIDWLNENIDDDAKAKYNDNMKGWCMGNDEYRATGTCSSVTVWFYRKVDAFRFMRRWSTHQKPTTYLNYFKDDYRVLKAGDLLKYNRSTKLFEE